MQLAFGECYEVERKGWKLCDGLDRVQLKIKIDWEEHPMSKAAHLFDWIDPVLSQRVGQ